MMTTKKQLPTGIYVQIYLDAVHGNTKQQKMQKISDAVDRLKTLGVKGILWHQASYEKVADLSVARFKELSLICSQRGLLSLAAWGLRDSTPEQDGAHIGLIANLPECFGVVFDMEGAWENEKIDKEKAVQIGKAFRKVSPNSLAFDQPWPEPPQHWTMFPWEETASFIDVRAPQDYYNDWTKKYGAERYKKLLPIFETGWKRLEDRRLKPKGLVRPRIKTIQGYKWNGIFSDLVNCLLINPTLFVWSEPFPDALFMCALEVVSKLNGSHFTGPNAVRLFQHSVGLTETDVCDDLVLAKLGIVLPTI
jgi:hypothetical protein